MEYQKIISFLLLIISFKGIAPKRNEKEIEIPKGRYISPEKIID